MKKICIIWFLLCRIVCGVNIKRGFVPTVRRGLNADFRGLSARKFDKSAKSVDIFIYKDGFYEKDLYYLVFMFFIVFPV